MPPDLRGRIARGDALFGTFLNTGSPMNAEICARVGFDWLLVDLEHGLAGEGDLLAHLHAIETAGLPAVVRVAQASRISIGRALDAGALGIMVPRIETIEEAAEAARALRFQPAGSRGIALFTRGAGLGSISHVDVADLNERVVGIFQVESRGSVAAAEAMAALDGVDVLFVGPTDLSHALGIPGQLGHPEYEAAVRAVGAAAARHGKVAGVLLWRPEDVDRYAAAGYRFFALSSDGALLDRAAREALATARGRQLG